MCVQVKSQSVCNGESGEAAKKRGARKKNIYITHPIGHAPPRLSLLGSPGISSIDELNEGVLFVCVCV